MATVRDTIETAAELAGWDYLEAGPRSSERGVRALQFVLSTLNNLIHLPWTIERREIPVINGERDYLLERGDLQVIEVVWRPSSMENDQIILNPISHARRVSGGFTEDHRADRPLQYWQNRRNDGIALWLWPIPVGGGVLVVWVHASVEGVVGEDGIDRDIRVPENFHDAIVSSLAHHMAHWPDAAPKDIAMLERRKDRAVATARWAEDPLRSATVDFVR